MTVEQVIEELSKYPYDTEVRIRIQGYKTEDFSEDSILYTSEDAHVDDSYPEDEWDSEDGKTVHSGKRFLLINPILN